MMQNIDNRADYLLEKHIKIREKKDDRLVQLLLKVIGNTDPELADALKTANQTCRPEHCTKQEDIADGSPQPRTGCSKVPDNVSGQQLPIIIVAEDNPIFPKGDTIAPAVEPEDFEQTAHMEHKGTTDNVGNSNPESVSEPVDEEELYSSIPNGHTTGTHHILQWESVSDIIKHQIDPEKIRQFNPQMIEINRGIIRLHGCGEGFEHIQTYDSNNLRNETRAEAIHGCGGMNESLSSSFEQCWGTIGLHTPYTEPPSSGVGSHPESCGTLDKNEIMVLDKDVVKRLVDVYMKKLNIMHPIITNVGRDAFVSRFLKQTDAVGMSGLSKHAAPAQHDSFAAKGTKRKQATFLHKTALTTNIPELSQRSISACVVLLMLALGQICEHKTRIPDTPQVPHSRPQTDLVSDDIPSPSPMFKPPSSHTVPGVVGSSSITISRDLLKRTPSSGVCDGKPHQHATKNVDVIPGLAYFSVAMDILGNHKGLNTLHYVHANILASLYYGQLAKITQAHACLIDAGYALEVILEPSLKRFQAIGPQSTSPPDMDADKDQKRKDNHLLFAYWTCLQLESYVSTYNIDNIPANCYYRDIVAELTTLPQSGVLRLEHVMPYPDVRLAVSDGDLDEKAGQCYTAQLWMRKRLNFIHRALYGPGKSKGTSCSLS